MSRRHKLRIVKYWKRRTKIQDKMRWGGGGTEGKKTLGRRRDVLKKEEKQEKMWRWKRSSRGGRRWRSDLISGSSRGETTAPRSWERRRRHGSAALLSSSPEAGVDRLMQWLRFVASSDDGLVNSLGDECSLYLWKNTFTLTLFCTKWHEESVPLLLQPPCQKGETDGGSQWRCSVCLCSPTHPNLHPLCPRWSFF